MAQMWDCPFGSTPVLCVLRSSFSKSCRTKQMSIEQIIFADGNGRVDHWWLESTALSGKHNHFILLEPLFQLFPKVWLCPKTFVHPMSKWYPWKTYRLCNAHFVHKYTEQASCGVLLFVVVISPASGKKGKKFSFFNPHTASSVIIHVQGKIGLEVGVKINKNTFISFLPLKE